MTELRPQDLTIGYWYHSVKFNKPVQLTDLDFYTLVCAADGASIDSYISSMFEPLELTEDWLKRFRSERKHSFEALWSLNGILFTFDKERSRVFVGIGGGHRFLNYVHEFQNLFSLTGAELKEGE